MVRDLLEGHLKNLRFDKKLKTTFIAKYLANPRLVILLLLLVITIGIYSFLNLPKNLNPQVNIPIVFIQTILPGANPTDVEQLVTKPLEDPIRSLAKVKTVASTSTNSVSAISIEFEPSVDAEKAKLDVQNAVDSVSSLPTNAQTPKVQKLDFENQPVWAFQLSGETDDGSLFKFAKQLQTKLDDLPQIDKVDVSGLEETEVEITIKHQTLASYGLNPIQISPLITSSLKAFPAGSIKTEKGTFALSIDPQVVKIADIRNLRINLDGASVALADIAQIDEHPKPEQNKSFLKYPNENTKRSVSFSIFKTASTNIDQAVQASEKLIEEENTKNPQFKISSTFNTEDLINEQFNELLRDFSITIFLVVLVLFIFLGARQALVSALSAPLSFLIAFTVMKQAGITINFLSLFSLILSLGLLVDDTVVVMSAMTSYFRVGRFTPLETGLLVWRDYLAPVFTTTITTIWAFLPLLLASGIIGQFIKSIPVVVSTALAGSFFVSIFITLPLIIILLEGNYPQRVRILIRIISFAAIVGAFILLVPKNNNILLLELLAFFVFLFVANLVRTSLFASTGKTLNKIKIYKNTNWPKIIDHGLFSFRIIANKYQRVIESILASPVSRVRVIVVVVILLVFSLLLVPLGFVKNEFFPKTDQDIIYISVELPAGATLESSEKEAKELLKTLSDTKELKFAGADIGRSFQSGFGISAGGQNNILLTLNLTRHKDRNFASFDIAENIRKRFANYTAGTLNVQEETGGPPAGADVQIKILGDDLTQLDSYTEKTEEYLKTLPGLANVNKTVKSGTGKLTFVPDKSALVQNQISLDQLGLFLRLYASGLSVDKNQFEGENESKDITIRLSSKTATVQSLYSLNIPTQNGNVPLSALGKLTLEPNPTLITREDGKRTISVTASVIKGHSVQEANKKLETFVDSELKLAEGYSWKTGGVNKENQESVNSILQAMGLSFLLIIVTMVIQFASFRRAGVVMMVIPLSISGVFIIFALTQTPLSFPALVGLLALFGIVVKNSILMVDKIVKNENEGLTYIRAIGDAAASRLEPIALTSFAAIFGLIPITLSDPLWRGLGGAIIAGLTFSGTIMLFFIPVVYYYLFRKN